MNLSKVIILRAVQHANCRFIIQSAASLFLKIRLDRVPTPKKRVSGTQTFVAQNEVSFKDLISFLFKIS